MLDIVTILGFYYHGVLKSRLKVLKNAHYGSTKKK